MQKEAYYFSHDANARNDVKCLKLRREMGWEGYGIFWALIEILREQPGHELPINSIDDLAYDLHADPDKLSAIINNYGLFVVAGNVFSSARLLRSMEQYNSRRKKLSEAGRKGGLSQAKASLEPPPSIKGKENKLKEIKGKESKERGVGETVLTDIDIGATIEYVQITGQRLLTHDQVKQFWKAFLIHAKGEYHRNKQDILQHFRNWIKLQPHEKPKQIAEDAAKPGAVKNWKV